MFSETKAIRKGVSACGQSLGTVMKEDLSI